MSGNLTAGGTLGLQTLPALVEEMAAAAQGASTTPLNFEDGSVLLAIIEALGGQLLWFQYLLLQVLAVSRLATSTGADCDTFGADFGFTRLAAVAATGAVTFSRYSATATALIPVGATVATADNTQSFTVTADPTNAAYVAAPVAGYIVPVGIAALSVPAQAVTAGSAGNVLANTISLIVGGIWDRQCKQPGTIRRRGECRE